MGEEVVYVCVRERGETERGGKKKEGCKGGKRPQRSHLNHLSLFLLEISFTSDSDRARVPILTIAKFLTNIFNLPFFLQPY